MKDLMGYKKRKELGEYNEIEEIPQRSTNLLYWIIAFILFATGAFVVGMLTANINIVLK